MSDRITEALGKAYAVPLEVCVAESVVVAADDPDFNAPTKPVGQF